MQHHPSEPPPSTAAGAALTQGLKGRQITMISIGGVIGAGLFVGSSTAVATAGPAVLVSFLLAAALVVLVMQMLGEMAVARTRTGRSAAGPASPSAGSTGGSTSSSSPSRPSRRARSSPL
jgi:L-asparagine transporter-like permease